MRVTSTTAFEAEADGRAVKWWEQALTPANRYPRNFNFSNDLTPAVRRHVEWSVLRAESSRMGRNSGLMISRGQRRSQRTRKKSMCQSHALEKATNSRPTPPGCEK